MPEAGSKPAFLPVAIPVLGEAEAARVAEAVRSGWISYQGPFVREFEAAFAKASGALHGVAVSSGTTALHTALSACGVGPGDEVILPALSHIAAANMTTLCGADIVLVDCDEKTWGMDPALVEAAVTNKTKAVIPVHLYGHPVDMDPLLTLAKNRGFSLVCDAAEAHGAEYKGRPIGGLGDFSCYSFYANKIITTGEGGMVLTNSREGEAKARSLMDEALDPKRPFVYEERGFSYRMSNVQAAIGVGQTERLAEFAAAHRKNAQRYNNALAGIPGLTLPPEQPWAKNVYWMYSLIVGPEFPLGRDKLRRKLREEGIDSRPFFHPVHQQPLYRARFKGQSFPVAERLAACGINLPSGNGLSPAEIDRVAAAVIKAAA